MRNGKTNVIAVNGANHNSQNSISLGKQVLQYTIKCGITSLTNLWVGINQQANSGFILVPGESVTIADMGAGDRIYLDEDVLYLRFDPSGSVTGGVAQIIVLNDTRKPNKCE